jgi:hypothetical protein
VNISFQLTQAQIINKTKWVTRRLGWKKLKPGQVLLGVEKSQGLKKGEKVRPLRYIEVVSSRPEPLNLMELDWEYGKLECQAEGFPDMRPDEFVTMFCTHNKCLPSTEVQRIHFKFRDDLRADRGESNPSPKEKDLRVATKKKGAGAINPPAPVMDETKAKAEKDSIDKAFKEAVVPKEEDLGKPKARIYTEPQAPDEDLAPPYEFTTFVPFSDSEKLAKLEKWGSLGAQLEELELEKKKENERLNSLIKDIEAEIRNLNKAVREKGEEREIMVQKRINYNTGIATIFDASTLEIVDRRRLTLSEMQVRAPLPSGRVTAGPWPGAGKDSDGDEDFEGLSGRADD